MTEINFENCFAASLYFQLQRMTSAVTNATLDITAATTAAILKHYQTSRGHKGASGPGGSGAQDPMGTRRQGDTPTNTNTKTHGDTKAIKEKRTSTTSLHQSSAYKSLKYSTSFNHHSPKGSTYYSRAAGHRKFQPSIY
jgi:hypothetical protein